MIYLGKDGLLNSVQSAVRNYYHNYHRKDHSMKWSQCEKEIKDIIKYWMNEDPTKPSMKVEQSQLADHITSYINQYFGLEPDEQKEK